MVLCIYNGGVWLHEGSNLHHHLGCNYIITAYFYSLTRTRSTLDVFTQHTLSYPELGQGLIDVFTQHILTVEPELGQGKL